ncbi:hypothetical protein [Streptomyces sp. ITFR-6]|uniref:hypothetical protein n=1 Tax=Streptomyces sp. ITFR-6 TaxID=3075197 RepID=UPI00288AF193|nr:hypothetical protein [Streptomyces sp. ITFR-6]WNI32992.1 hypothetical protein RLT59_32490 [Streptomyces sp. ITFR-6]
MTSDRRGLTALHLLLVWAAMAVTVPALGFTLLASAWGGGFAGTVPVLVLGVPVTVGLLSVTGIPVRGVVPLCDTASRRFGWAVAVFVLGTLGVLAGLAAYGSDVDLGSAGAGFALSGVPYAAAAALFVPSRWVRLGALAAPAAAVAYGGFVGPAQSRERQREAEIARYREHAELLYVAAAPAGMELTRTEAGPGYFRVEYRPEGRNSMGYVDINLRTALTPAAQCPEPVSKGDSCTVDAHGGMRMVRTFPGGRTVTLTRRLPGAEAEASSQTLDEPGLRRLLDTLHPLSDPELRELMREKKIDRRN